MTWMPQPAVLRAMRSALAQMQAFYPKALGMATQNSLAADQWVGTYCRSLLGKRISLDTLAEAAARWPAEHGRETPYPAEFAAFAAKIDAELHPPVPQWAEPVAQRPEVPRPAHADDVERMSLEAYVVLKSWPMVSHAWGLAWKLATTDQMRDDVRLGRVPSDVWGQCISDTLHEFQRRAA
jgi:hypothetical protein